MANIPGSDDWNKALQTAQEIGEARKARAGQKAELFRRRKEERAIQIEFQKAASNAQFRKLCESLAKELRKNDVTLSQNEAFRQARKLVKKDWKNTRKVVYGPAPAVFKEKAAGKTTAIQQGGEEHDPPAARPEPGCGDR